MSFSRQPAPSSSGEVSSGIRSWQLFASLVIAAATLVVLPGEAGADGVQLVFARESDEAPRASQTPSISVEAVTDTAPALPSRVSAHLVFGTTHGKAIRFSYCFTSLSQAEQVRPRWIRLTLRERGDSAQKISLSWPVRRRCASVLHPVGGIDPPYRLSYHTENLRGAMSREVIARVSR
jgi:hypothetical protein